MQIPVGSALFMQMGTGKTLTSIHLIETLCYNGYAKNTLVIAPLSIVNTWQQELDIHTNSGDLLVTPVVGAKPKRLKVLSHAEASLNPLKLFLINPEGVQSVEKELSKIDFDFVIVDESTMIKNRTAGRSKIIKKLFQNVKYKLLLSGNPIPKGGQEIFSQYEFIEPGVFGTNYYRFVDHYFFKDYFNNVAGMQPGLKDEFESKFHEVSFVKRKDECLDLPPKIYETIEIEMAPEQRKLYKEMEKEAITFYEDQACAAPVVITKFLRLSQIAGGIIATKDENDDQDLKRFDKNPKLDQLISTISELPSENQVVIWARFNEEIEMISEALTKADISNVTFYGKNRTTRDEGKALFREKQVRAFIGNPQAGGKGLNDLIGATYVIYYSNDFSSEARQQSEDRNHRSGTKGDKVVYVDLVMKGTIDKQVIATLRDDRDFSDMILERKINLK
jgi:SNF2 family DNA or RNA helicase